ncbi:hypothetical protein DMC30DRAFT_389132 [Rhodotorula diobovata]|uniref:Uncharacterized protein n=1 Tax=Rhodotorula diobovata TaxID=5288 RepID=A0A5C5G3Z1_9BASI|nr:hypothetical protein DMC30DRAFT_389132 [Rhodotorula diobovata]
MTTQDCLELLRAASLYSTASGAPRMPSSTPSSVVHHPVRLSRAHLASRAFGAREPQGRRSSSALGKSSRTYHTPGATLSAFALVVPSSYLCGGPAVPQQSIRARGCIDAGAPCAGGLEARAMLDSCNQRSSSVIFTMLSRLSVQPLERLAQ